MLNVTISGIHCRLSLLFPAVLLYLLYTDQSGLSLFCFSAAIIHESGHLMAAYILSAKPKELTVSCFGMRLRVSDSLQHPSQEVLIALAGPLMNLMHSVLLYVLPVNTIYAKLHIVMVVFNLLPVLPLDGGRILHAVIFDLFQPLIVARIETVVFACAFVPLFVLGGWLALTPPHNITLLIVGVYLLILKVFYNGN